MSDGFDDLTRVERYIDSQVAPHLESGELISHRGTFALWTGPKRDASLIRDGAIGMLGFVGGGSQIKRMANNRAFFLALTPRRLFLIETRPGIRGPKLKNNWIGWWSPAEIRFTVSGDQLRIETQDGKSFPLELDRSTKHCRTQAALLTTLGIG